MLDFKIAVSDLDGTLLDAEHKISEYTKNAIKKLLIKGAKIGIATGRHYTDAKAIRKILGLNSFLISSNGAMIHDANDKLIVSEMIRSEIVEDIFFNFDLDSEVKVNLYTEEGWLVTHVDVTLEDYHKDSNFSFRQVCLDELHDYEAIKLYFTCFDIPKLDKLEQQILSKYSNEVDITYAMPFCLEVMKKGVNKGEALNIAMASEGLTAKDAIAFGDGLNDYEMLCTAGASYIMENASEKLKALLPNHQYIGLHTENAVAKFLEQAYARLGCETQQ